MKKLKYLLLTIKDFVGFVWFLFLYKKDINKLGQEKQKPVWLFADRGVDASDNGLILFEYIVKNHPEIDAYFVISDDTKNTKDYKKVKNIGNILHRYSKKHKLYFLISDALISSHIHVLEPWRARILEKFSKNYRNKKNIFLQHGIIKDDISNDLGTQKQNLDIFICGAKPEYDFVLDKFGYDESVVKYTGLARYDNLHNFETKKQILLMPTWRQYIEQLLSENDSIINYGEFIKTNYYKKYNDLLNNVELQSVLSQNKIELIFYPHHNVQKMMKCFKTTSKNIKIASKENYDVATLLKESKLLITDYSSVFFDFAYMQKPMIYYQFDEEEFFSKHYKKGYFDYRRNGFGEVVTEEKKLIDSIEKIIKNNFEMEEKYKKRIDGFFPLHDQKNCERIYNEIINISNN